MPALRRPRMHRVPSSTPFALTARDTEIFHCLIRYRYLRSTYLHAFAGGRSVKRFVERLCDLFHQGLVGRAPQQWQFADARCQPLVYEAEPRAHRFLSPLMDAAARTYLGSDAHRQFHHALAICESLASIELATAARNELRFIPWSEILDRAPEHTRTSAAPFHFSEGTAAVIPDALFGLEYRSGSRKAYRFFALEIDRGTMPVKRRTSAATSVFGKLATYGRFIEGEGPRRVLGIPNLFVLTITSSSSRVGTLVESVARNRSAPWLLFKTAEDSALREPLPALLIEPWTRAGLPQISIAEPE